MPGSRPRWWWSKAHRARWEAELLAYEIGPCGLAIGAFLHAPVAEGTLLTEHQRASLQMFVAAPEEERYPPPSAGFDGRPNPYWLNFYRDPGDGQVYRSFCFSSEADAERVARDVIALAGFELLQRVSTTSISMPNPAI